MRTAVPGVGLQFISILFGYLSNRLLYSAGWFGILVISIPLYVISVVVLMRARMPLWARLLLSAWPWIFPFTMWEVW